MTTESKSLDEIVDQVIAFARERNIALMPGFPSEQAAGVTVCCATVDSCKVRSPGHAMIYADGRGGGRRLALWFPAISISSPLQ